MDFAAKELLKAVAAGKPVPLGEFFAVSNRLFDRPIFCGIYYIHCTVSGCVYVGSSIDILRRWRVHCRALQRGKHHSEIFQRSFDKYLIGAFTLQFVEAVAAKCFQIEETRHIQEHAGKLLNVNLIAECPMGGRRHSDATRAKMSNSRKGKKFSDEWRRNMSAALKGRPHKRGWTHGEATRAKISDAHKGNTYMLGKKHTPEAKQRISAALRIADHSKKKRGAEHPGARAVVIDNVQYDTVRAAASALGVFARTVTKRITAGMGRYADDPDGRQTKVWGLEDKRGSNHKNARAVLVDGLRFDCCKDAAAHFGIHPSSFVEWIRKGRARYEDGLPPMRIGPRSKAGADSHPTL